VTNCTFTNNTAVDDGGAMYNGESSPTVTDCTFDGNTANAGGGIYNSNSSPMVTDCTFTGNSAIETGGAMFNNTNSNSDIGDTLFCDNDPDDIAGPGTWNDLGGNVFSCAFHVPANFATIQSAIDAASDGSEIIVAPGTYNEAINLQGKAVHLHSADGPDVTIIDATGLKSRVVLCNSGEGPDTIIEGFTITGGNASTGGGMRNTSSSPTVINCIFAGNTADSGGGMYNNHSSPIVTNCIFIGNEATDGGGIYNGGNSSPTVTDCTFENNSGAFRGGGMFNGSIGIVVVTGCTFDANVTTNRGGGMYNNTGTPIVTDCTFTGNAAGSDGGGMYIFSNSSPEIGDTIFCENDPDNLAGPGPWTDLGGNEFSDSCKPDSVPGDLNGDSVVDGGDLLILLANWGKCDDCDNCAADLNDTCVVDGADLLILLTHWG